MITEKIAELEKQVVLLLKRNLELRLRCNRIEALFFTSLAMSVVGIAVSLIALIK